MGELGCSSKAALVGAALIAAMIPAFAMTPAAAALKRVIILQKLDAGTPPLIDLYQEDRLRLAPLDEELRSESQEADTPKN
jgi:hypothetical protein